MRRAILAAALALASMAASAAGSVTSLIAQMETSAVDNHVVITVYIPPTGQPACATQVNQFRLNLAATGGEMMHDILMSAFIAGKPVYLLGTGTCPSPWPAYEALTTVRIQ